MQTGGEAEEVEALEAERRRLTNALQHLERSNLELEEALRAEPGEREYVLAIRENQEVMLKYCAQVAALALLLELARGGPQ